MSSPYRDDRTRWVRYFTQERALLAVFTLYLTGCVLLLLFIRSAAHDTLTATLREKANALITVLLPRPSNAPPISNEEFSARWLIPSMGDNIFERTADVLMHQPRGARLEELRADGANAGYEMAIANGKGDVLLLTIPIDPVLRSISSDFQRTYIIVSLLGLVVLSGIAVTAMRRRNIAIEPGRAERPPLQPASGRDWMTACWVIALSALIFFLELRTPLEAGVGIAYVAVVLFALRFAAPQAIYLTTILCTVLTVVALFLTDWNVDMWAVLANRTLRIFALWSVAVLGLWQRRASNARAEARAEASQIRELNETLQQSLQRAEIAEAGLRKGQRLIQAVSRMARIGGWEYDVKTGTPSWSDEVYAIHEIDSHFKPDMNSALDFFRPEVRKVIEQSMERAVEDGASFDLTVPFVTAKGRSLWVRTIGTAEQENGKTVRLSGAMQDLTVQHEAQLRLSRGARLTAEGLWEYDFGTKLVWCSETYQSVLGFPSQERITTLADLLKVHQDDAQNAQAAFDYHIATGAPFNLLARKATAAGKWRWFRLRGAVERDDAKRPLRFCGTLNDVHQEKLIHEELKLTRMRLNRAITGSSDGLYEIDLTGRTSEWYSPRARALLGFGPEDTFGGSLASLAHPDDSEAVRAAMDASVEADSPLDLVCRLRTRSGEHRWIRIRGRGERDANGVPVLFSGSLQDVTEQRAADEALKVATEAAAAANRAKGDFLANMSHEIRTPMNGVLGMTELLLDTKLSSSQRDFADTIRASATALLILIDDLLDFSKIEAGKLELERIPMDLRACVEDVGLLMAVNAHARKLELVVNVQPGVPNHVIGDPTRLSQILINLIGNAIKFTQQGEIAVEVSPVAVQAGRHLLHFEVRDTGMGMKPEIVSRLFQPFTQADVSTTRHHGGTGLGLSIVRRLVGMMGGEVSVATQPGQGSTFCFTLAFDPAEEPSTEVPQLTSAIASARNILVVDDNETNRRVLKGQLESIGLQAWLAAGPLEVTQILEAIASQGERLSAGIIDDRIAETSGIEVARQIHASEPNAHLPLIMLTSLDRNADDEEVRDAGFSGFLTKPIRRNELLGCLERVLAHRGVGRDGDHAIVTRASLAGIAARRRFTGRVLIVEDNPVNQEVARRFLERLGCEVTVAANGAEGVDAFFKAEYVIVLMDVQMPVMDGLEATREIRAREGGRHTPIVALTASAMTDELERCMSAGMDALLTKPIEPVKLDEILRRFGVEASRPSDRGSSAGAGKFRIKGDAGGLDSEPVDLSTLLALADGDREFVRDLCHTFEASAGAILEDLVRAQAVNDRERIVTLAHKLKGGSASIRALRLTRLCADLEGKARSLSGGALSEAIKEIAAAAREIAPFIATQLEGAAA